MGVLVREIQTHLDLEVRPATKMQDTVLVFDNQVAGVIHPIESWVVAERIGDEFFPRQLEVIEILCGQAGTRDVEQAFLPTRNRQGRCLVKYVRPRV